MAVALFVAVIVFLIVLGGLAPAVSAQEEDLGAPGGGHEVRVARPTWDTGWFQAEIIAHLLVELGYAVDGPRTLDNRDFYLRVGNGSIDLWVNGWLPLHEGLIEELAASAAVAVGSEVEGGALQGYLADKETVERFGIDSLSDLSDPEKAANFDVDGDGRADLIGCEPGWACGPIVEHHLDAYGLTDTVEQIQGDYGPLMESTVDRFQSGESVLFYTFTPNWTVGELVPGVDVVWLPAPFPSLPDDLVDQEPLSEVPGVQGCLDDPCSMGFAPNDIRAIANREFLAAHPAVEALLERFELSLEEISEQNAKMVAGEDSAADIVDHARQWVEANRTQVDEWLSAATQAHIDAGLPLSPRPTRSSPGGENVGTMRVVTRLAPPFVTYEANRYGGFIIELLELIADEIGADLEIYAVNSSAKLVDEIGRGQADVGIGAVAITAQRERLVDFSQPFFDSGLQILVADRDEGFLGGRIIPVLRAVASRQLLVLFAVLVGLLILAAHVIWLSERRTNPEFPQSYVEGVWESLWWAAVTVTTVGYGDKTPKGVIGRLFSLAWMFSGLFLLAYFTAGIAAAFTIDELTGAIGGPSDLRGRSVGVAADTRAANYLQNEGVGTISYPDIDDAYDALFAGEIEAVVHEAAILQHFLATDGRGGLHLSGVPFAERGFGFVLQPESDLTEPINHSLLALIESGDYADLSEQWFGTTTADSG